MSDRIIMFTRKGDRVPRDYRLTDEQPQGTLLGDRVYAWPDRREWVPGVLGVKGARGYRVVHLEGGGEVQFLDERQVDEHWEPAPTGVRWLPTVAALEMYVRMTL